MFCKKLCCDITIRLVTINFQSCITYSVTPTLYTENQGDYVEKIYVQLLRNNFDRAFNKTGSVSFAYPRT
jgi:hypothetical protein